MSYNFGGASGLSMATFTLPPASNTFTANPNNGSSTLSTLSNGSLLLNGPKAATSEANNAAFYRAKSGAKTIIACVRHSFFDYNATGSIGSFGLYFSEAATRRIKIFHQYMGIGTVNNLNFQSYTNPVTYSSGGTVFNTAAFGGIYWLKLQDDGVNIIGSWSSNGLIYAQAASEARGTWLTTTPGGDRMGIWVSPESAGTVVEVLSYSEI